MPDFKELIRDFIDDQTTTIEAYARIARAVCLLVGPVFLGFSLFFIISTFRFLHRAVPANATIIQLLPEIDHEDNSVTYRPVFRFVAGDGRTYEVRANAASNPSPYAVGDTAPVLYEPGHPAQAKLHAFWDLWGLALVFAILGSLATAVGLALRRFERWLDRRGLSITPHDSGVTAG